MSKIASWMGLIRSLIIYWRPGRQNTLRKFYSKLVSANDLVFDVGAHLGDRSSAFAWLGAKVVSIEPQPEINKWLRRLVGRNRKITIIDEALGGMVGTSQLAISQLTPTVSTVADSWKDRIVTANPSFSWVRWDHTVEVKVTTLDMLIATHGVPHYCKIDVEGYELDVLKGLSYKIDLISFEFVYGDIEAAISCIEYLEGLGSYEYNIVIGEEKKFKLERWIYQREIIQMLVSEESSSGDLYARLVNGLHCDKKA